MNPKPLSSASSLTRRADNSRQLTSDHIREHLAAFEAGGGQVEVLGTTVVLRRIDGTAPAVAKAR